MKQEKMECCVCSKNCDPRFSCIITQVEWRSDSDKPMWYNYPLCSVECATYFLANKRPQDGTVIH